MLADSFGLPVGAPNRDNVIAWLRLLGSVEGQDVFNPLEGPSPPAPTVTCQYNAYLQSAAEDWQTNEIVGSLAHGAWRETFSSEFATVMEQFLASRNAQATSAAEALAEQAGIAGTAE